MSDSKGTSYGESQKEEHTALSENSSSGANVDTITGKEIDKSKPYKIIIKTRVIQ
jgi:hypothetical protein